MKGVSLVNSGLVTLSQYPILAHTFIPFQAANLLSFDALSNKGFLACVVRLPQKEICVINVHLQSGAPTDYPIVQYQLRQVFEYARQLTIPYIIGGDFNIHYSEVSEAFYAPAVCKVPPTPTIYIHDSGDSLSRPRSGYYPYTFDYFFVHPTLTPHCEVVSEGADYSDHNPCFLIVERLG